MDAKFVWRDLAGEVALEGDDLAREEGLETAVIHSLFTDRLAMEDDPLPYGEKDRRGWWGDHYLPTPFDRVGSRLWLLHREK